MHDTTKAAARLLLGLAVLIGVPAALTVTVGWPLPRAVPSWTEITDGFSRQGVQTDTVIRVLAVIVWCAWAQLAVAIVVEATAAMRGRTSSHLALLPGTQLMARQFVASATIVLTVLGPDRAASAIPGNTPELAVIEVAPAIAVAAAAPVASDTPTTTPVPPGEYVVQSGDSYWGLAETHLGDGSRWAEIRDANAGRTVDGGRVITALDDDLHPGWRILLPTAGEATAEPAAPTSVGSSEVQVAPGDHFWGLAESHLRDAWGRPVSEAEVREYWSILVEANRDRLVPPGDPSRIYAGQVFVTPDPGPDPTRPAPERSDPGEAQHDGDDDPAPGGPIDDAAGEGAGPARESPLVPPTAEQAEPSEATDPAESSIEQPAPDGAGTDREDSPVSTSTVPATTAGPLDAPVADPAPGATDGEDGDDPGSAAPVVPLLGVASTALAVAVLRELRRRRARRAVNLPVNVVPPAPPRSTHPVAREVLVADEAQVNALDAALASLCTGLNPRGGERCIQPKVVQVTGHRVEVMLDRPDPAPPAPWRPEASGRVWVLDDASDMTATDAVSPLPALVTIGVDDAELLIDLEAFGVVTLTGDHDNCWAIARSMVTELAANPDGAIGIELVGALDGRLDNLDGVRRIGSWDDADTGVVVGSARMLDAGRWPHTFAARASGRVFDGWAPAIWVTAPSDSARYRDVVEQVATRPGAGSAIVIVAGGDVDAPATGGLRIVIDSDGGFRVPELSLAGRAQLLHAEAADQVIDLLDDAAHTTFAETIDFPTPELDDDALVDDEEVAIVGLDDDSSPPLGDTRQEQQPPSALDTAYAPSRDDRPATDLPASHRSLSPDQDRYEDPPWKVLVRVCGEIAVEGGKSTLTGPEAAAATYVTLHREADVDQIRNAIWSGQDVSRKRVRNVLANVRRALGEEMYYVSEGRLAAGEQCLTDHELIRRRLAYARHQTDPAARVETLRGALEWVTGKVCTYPSRTRRTWGWIDFDNWIPNIESTVGALAHDLAALYLELGDAEGATWAASRGIDATGPREQLTVLLVRGYALVGDDPAAAAALRAYERYMEDLGSVDHSEELLKLLDRYLPAGRIRAS
jgi:nucleoid-associated protein YgaU/DNA-binding SARP family transcriptional activator